MLFLFFLSFFRKQMGYIIMYAADGNSIYFLHFPHKILYVIVSVWELRWVSVHILINTESQPVND